MLRPALSKRRATRQRGAAVIETALSLVLLTIVLFSIFDFGWNLFVRQSFRSRAGMAARYAVTHPDNLASAKHIVLYGSTAGPTQGQVGLLGLTDSMVSVTRDGANTPDDRVTVSISDYTYRTLTPGFAGVWTGRPLQITMPVEVP